ncbi:hypothetical protein [Streptomyces sp. ISL-11]|uniref:hypothetical protein n=1 Tax=Streptomyces sp. ISL-11 TaxID=2819174 RepID=UPI001BE69065|nr:hypothetical protein [Streptomyces sp. ISL-11]MBT2385384.1 hypothetical protein [Streptomyces sp. ISL-11]
MRINKLTSTAIAVVACGSLALGAAGPALAAPEPRPAVKPVEPKAVVQQRLDTAGALGETFTLVARIGKEAQAKSPDVKTLRSLQQQLQKSSDQLLRSARKARPSHPAAGPAGRAVPDPTAEIKQALDKLVKDVTKLIADVARKDTAAVVMDVAATLMDLKDLLAKIPPVLTGAAAQSAGTVGAAG